MHKKFKISLKVYKKEKLLQAIKDVSWDIDIELQEDELVIFWESEDEIEEVFQEFMNYVLFI